MEDLLVTGSIAATGMFFSRRGHGRPIVFLHGWCLSGRLWTYSEEHFCARFQVVIPDLAGFGRSSNLAGPYSFDRHASDVISLLEEFNLKGAVIVGFAYGAAVGMTLAAERPDLVSRIVNVGVPLASATPYEKMPRSMRRDWPDFARRSAKSLFHSSPSEATVSWIERMFADTALPVAVETVSELARLDATLLAKKIRVQQLFINSREDSVAPISLGEQCVTVAPDAELKVIENSGHLIVIDGKEAFHALLDGYVGQELAQAKST